jgi:hypothetical protein
LVLITYVYHKARSKKRKIYTDTSKRVLFASDLACEIQTGLVWHIRHVVRSTTMKHVHDRTDVFSTTMRTAQWEGP